MSTVMILGNTIPINNSYTGTRGTVTSAGIHTYYVHPFIAYQSETINRIQLVLGTITSGANYTLTVGIGTIDTATGTGYTSDISLLAFSSSTTATNLTSNTQPIFAIPDFITTIGTKYYVGWQVTATTGAFAHNAIIQANPADMIDGNSLNPISRTNSTLPTVIGGVNSPSGGKYASLNWGYDTGTAVTSWYNRLPGHYNFAGIAASLTAMKGMTFFTNLDCESIYVDSICCAVRNPSAVFPSGYGTTWHMTLYDTDGTTALIGHTMPAYSRNTAQSHHFTFPVKYWLQNRKLYHFAFAGVSTNAQANTTLIYQDMIYDWQAGLAFTSIYFTKTSGSASPVYDSTKNLYFQMHITDMRGSIQGSVGNVTIF